VTKRRPWWSDSLRQAAALACGLLLVSLPAPLWAGDKAASRAAAAKKPAVARSIGSDIGTADIVESDLVGLHGSASFYGGDFHGRRTATGESFDMRNFTAASNRFPLGSWVAVRRLDNNRCAVVKINDRMHARHRKRVIDVSRGVAEYLDMVRSGVVLVRVAQIKGDRRSDSSCQAAFEAEAPEPDLSALRTWVQPAPAQLDAMH
jgi:rare lipoprotein A